MTDTPYRCARKNDLTAALAVPRIATRLRVGLLVGAIMVLALAASPGADAAMGGAASAAPTVVETEATETSTAFTEAELSFTPFRFAGASWYGPGLWGRTTACGETLRPTTIGVANKTLPCGTPVKFVWHGHSIVAPVIDRGPYVKGRSWDLTAAASEALAFEGVGRIRYAVAIEYASTGL